MENNEDSIKIFLPKGTTPDDLKELLTKAEIPLKASFQDPVIEEIAENMFKSFDEMQGEMLQEINTILTSEYGS